MMMTKDQYANYVIDTFCESNGINREEVTDWGVYMRASSSLAVCLEHLKMLSREDMRYSKTRGGFGMFHPITHLVISTRDILGMLPDDENQLNFLKLPDATGQKFTELIATHDLSRYAIQVNKTGTDLYIEIDHVNEVINIITTDTTE